MYTNRDGPSQLLSQPDDNKWELDGGLPVAEALQSLVQLVPGAQQVQPGINCGGRFAAASVPPLPAGTGGCSEVVVALNAGCAVAAIPAETCVRLLAQGLCPTQFWLPIAGPAIIVAEPVSLPCSQPNCTPHTTVLQAG